MSRDSCNPMTPRLTYGSMCWIKNALCGSIPFYSRDFCRGHSIPRISLLIGCISVLTLGGCDVVTGPVPHGPYQFYDNSDRVRTGGDFLGMITYKPTKRSDYLQPPQLLYPLDRMTFSHYPRELVYRWRPADGTPPDAQFIFECDFICGNDEKFGDC